MKTIRLIVAGYAVMAATVSMAATLRLERQSVVVVAGKSVEIPLLSEKPIAGDLTARGAFDDGDVQFSGGPGCRLSANHCTLFIKASPASKRYTAVPVVVSESAATNTPVFLLSVIHPGDREPDEMKSPAVISKLRSLSTELGRTTKVSLKKPTPHDLRAVPPTVAVESPKETLQRSGNDVFYGVAQPHPGIQATGRRLGYFTPDTNGPSYQIIELTNRDVEQPLSVKLSGSGADGFILDDVPAHFGSHQKCASLNRIAPMESCLVIVKGKVGDPRQAPRTATLIIQGNEQNVASFTLRSTTYVYAAGGFDTLGNASVSGGSLLAQCTAGTCSNALQGTSGNNYASTSFSVGQWINAMSVTSTGNLIVGGVFGAMGGATSGASSGTAALLAQCTPGAVVGNACINQIGTGISNPYAFNNAYINSLTPPQATNFLYLGGDFGNIRGFSVTSGGRMVAKCGYSGTSSNQTCNAFLGSGVTSTKYANAAVAAVIYFNSKVGVGGLFTQVAGYPASAPASGTTFASCTSSTCSEGMDSNNPDGSILSMSDDGTSVYMGGAFTQIGGYVSSGGGYPLVSCTTGATTTCNNALSGTNEANGFIQAITYSGGNLYVGGYFTTIGGATAVASGNMLAVCTPGGTCSNLVTDTNPYATGSDWGGSISAVAVGDQTSIIAN